jgi:hypothetical protein
MMINGYSVRVAPIRYQRSYEGDCDQSVHGNPKSLKRDARAFLNDGKQRRWLRTPQRHNDGRFVEPTPDGQRDRETREQQGEICNCNHL